MWGWSSETRAQLELQLAKDMNNTKESVHSYFGNKRKVKENMGTLFGKVGDVKKESFLYQCLLARSAHRPLRFPVTVRVKY